MSQSPEFGKLSAHDRIVGGIIGLVVGDALGVPVEFQPRERLEEHPVTARRSWPWQRNSPRCASHHTQLGIDP